MDAEKIREALESILAATNGHAVSRGAIRAYANTALALLAQPQSVQAGGWISVKDRLPEDSDPVVVSYRQVKTRGPTTCFAQWFPTIGEGEWRTTGSNSIVTPTHWYPLPAAPKEEPH